jgi:hypothetical protein
MKTHRLWFFAVSTLTLAACAPPELDFPDGPAPDSPEAPAHLDGPAAAGWTEAGDLALFDTKTGEVIALAEGAGLSGPRDLVLDRWRSRLLAVEGGVTAQNGVAGEVGEIASYPLLAGESGLALGPRRPEALVAGAARLAASPFGAVVFEDGDTPVWWLLPQEGEPVAAVSSPLPASLKTTYLTDGHLRLTALTHGASGDAVDLRISLVGEDGLSAPIFWPLAASPVSAPPTTRWVESYGGGQLVDAADGDVTVSTFAGSGYPVWMPAGVGPGIERIEQAVSWPDGSRVALLTSGAADLVVFGTTKGGAPECAAALDLPGEAEPAGPSLVRSLLVVGPDRLLAATSSGVYAVTVSADCPPRLAVDPAFEGSGLRGPLAALPQGP